MTSARWYPFTTAEKEERNKDTYQLARGFLESTRLNLQHFLFQETFGYNLHPTIIESSQGVLKIADVGTGTGVWLSDLSASLSPDTQLHGFDITDAQFPSDISLPDNVKLHVVDAQAEPPQHMQGMYDVVHLRLFLGVVENDNPSRLVNHALKLLKPGGYLQWTENDTMAQESIGPEDAPKQSLEDLCFAPNRLGPKTWVEKLPRTLADAGFECCAVERKRELVWHRQMWMENICAITELIAASKLQANDPARERWETVQQRSRKAFEEARNGACFSHTLQVVVARKQVN